MRYDMKCQSCASEMEVNCKSDDRRSQVCDRCGGPLEVLISSDTAITRFGFGFAPSLVREDGTKVPGHERRRPASTKRGS